MSVTPLSSEEEQQINAVVSTPTPGASLGLRQPLSLQRETLLAHTLAGDADTEITFNRQWAERVFSETPEPVVWGNQLTIVHEEVLAIRK